MTGRESDQRVWDDRENEDWDPAPRRSLLWPLVTTVVAAIAIGHFLSLKRRLLNFERFAQQANKMRHDNNNGNTIRYTYWIYDGGRFYQRQGSVPWGRGSTPWERGRMDDPWSRIWREGFMDSEELARLERIRRMQEAFNRERAGYPGSYEWWQGSERTRGQDNRQTRTENWYWGRADSEARQNANRGRFESSQNMRRSPQAHHYDVLGLDVSRAGTYSQEEIKAAFRAKAMKYHPDRNQHRKDFAEAKFREVVSAYEALKK